MSRQKLTASLAVALVALGVAAASLATAQQAAEAPSAEQMALPAGWTMEDVQACIAAGTPGKQHAHLAANVGKWTGKCTMWMTSDSQPVTSECTATYQPMMDGRYISADFIGEMPGMGPYHGFCVYGYDNAGGKFVASAIDNHGTGIMQGTGELSEDGKTLSWKYNYTCPLTKKPTVMREIETITGDSTKTLEMWGEDPKTGKEYKMMQIEFTKA
ncbi:MAG TPA: DUF1579 domain-containing protein [Lacipirellulaceae bacterium]|nr:DUF1579 domain-containing protein [Lacipirellulaceae bacterium]